MKIEDTNRLIFEILDNIFPIETSKISMFDLNDIYKYPPFFRFKFKNIGFNSEMFERTQEIINNYKGELNWKLYSFSNSNNLIIAPTFFEIEGDIKYLYKKEKYIEIFGEKLFNKNIDKAISDIPKLATHIKRITC